MTTTLSILREKLYLENPLRCAYCGCRDIEGDNIEIEFRIAYQEINCKACGRTWIDVYTLTGVIV